MQSTDNTFYDLVSSSSDEEGPLDYDGVTDDRMGVLKVDSLYISMNDIKNNLLAFRNSKYCALHFNIHSLPSKHTELCNMISTLKAHGILVHFILLCETFLTEINADLFPIHGYNFIHNSRRTISRGGVAMYISNDLTYRERGDVCQYIEGQFESIAIEVEGKCGWGNIIVAEVYRVPNTNERISIERYDEMVTSLCSTKCELIIGTDQNFDLMKVHTHQNTSDLLNVLFTVGVLPTILRPTRVTHTSATLIDNIYLKSKHFVNIHSTILVSDISDHYPIITCMGTKVKDSKKAPLIFEHRPTNTHQIDILRNELHSTVWDDIFLGGNVSECYNIFISHFQKLLDECIPIQKCIIPRRRVIKQAWLTPGLVKSSRKCQILYRKTVGKDRDSTGFNKYLKYRNTLNGIKRKTKETYFKTLLNDYRNDIRKTWRVMNSIIGRSHNKSSIPDTFMVNGDKITDPNIITNEFCSFFSNIGKKCAESIPNALHTFEYYLGNVPNPSSLFFSPTDPYEIYKTIKSFKTKKSTGEDGISMELLKQLCEPCSTPISTLINMSLQQGIFPDAMKIAKVIPIHKAKATDIFNNYRPISLLSNVSKILEKVVHRRLLSFMTKHRILYDGQYGFRPKRSTIDAITDFVSDVLPSLDKRNTSLAVYLDLSKAFDTINHGILLRKLEYYGIRGRALEWFKSYLDQRRQYVNFGGVCSKLQSVEYGVPQGSVLGPLLFIIYSNDIPHSITYSKSILFADDTTVYITGSNLEIMYQHVNYDLKSLNDWFRANQLSVNPLKTKYIHFSRHSVAIDINIQLKIDSVPLERVNTTKFLGIYIDEHLTWESHIKYCMKKISSGTYAINMSKHVLSRSHLLLLYYSLVQPYLQYGIVLWGNAYQKHLVKLEIAQKKAIRAITGGKYNESTSPLFRSINILKLKDLLDLHTIQLMYRFINKELSEPLLHIFKYHGEVHDHDTRQSADPRPPKANSQILSKSFLCRGPTLWMTLDNNIKNSRTKSKLTKQVKYRFIREY